MVQRGYPANLAQPRLAAATHLSYDPRLVGDTTAGVRVHDDGMFAFGIDHTVLNVIKDRVWIREVGLPLTTNAARPGRQTVSRISWTSSKFNFPVGTRVGRARR